MREFMDDPPEADEVPEVCSMLRTKTAFGTLAGGRAWQLGSSTAAYWCLCTMQSSGPDDDFAHPHTCKRGRNCFRTED
jgi:hypothetical protein